MGVCLWKESARKLIVFLIIGPRKPRETLFGCEAEKKPTPTLVSLVSRPFMYQVPPTLNAFSKGLIVGCGLFLTIK
jgi:hypothetical protein